MSYLGLLINKCTIVREENVGWGETTLVTHAEKCRVEWDNRLVRDAHGEEVTSVALVFFKEDADVRSGDKVRLPDSDYDHPIIRFEKPQDYGAIHHREAFIA